MQATKLVLKPDPILTPVLAVGNQLELLLEMRMEWMCYSETSNGNIAMRRSWAVRAEDSSFKSLLVIQMFEMFAEAIT